MAGGGCLQLQARVGKRIHHGGSSRQGAAPSPAQKLVAHTPGKEKKIVLGHNMVGKPLSIKIRTNAEDFEIYKKRPLIDEDWEFVTDGSYQRGKDNKVQFRWGWYLGRTAGGSVKNDAMYFVTGTTIRKSTENPRANAAAKSSTPGKPQKTAGPTAPELRTWTNLQGRTMQAKLRRFNHEAVEILRADDMSFSIPLKRLSEADLEYLKLYRNPDCFLDL